MPVALLLESIVLAGQLFVNDEHFWSDFQLTEPLSRSWNMPRYWRIPESVLHPGVNTLWLRVVGLAEQTPGLGPVHLGEPQALMQQYEDLLWRNRSLFMFNLIITGVMGGLSFCIWVVRREQRAYGWYALMSLLWVLFISNVLATSPWPFANSLMAARVNIIVLLLYVACFCIFTWRFGRQLLPRAEKALWVTTAVMVVAMAAVPDAYMQGMSLLSVIFVSCVFFLNCSQFPVHALRTRQPEHLMMAACLIVFLVVSLHDLLGLLKLIPLERMYTPFTSVVVTLCMSAILGSRHARTMRRIERFNVELADGIEQARNELSTTLEREHTLAMANTRLQDRLQIAHDLHDGIGGSLVRMMALVEQADAPLHNQQVLSFLKLIRDDLRQTIDSGSSSGIKVPNTPLEWVAPLRHRYVQLFDELGIESSWEFPARWRFAPNALQCMALTRLVEESLTNVIKHSRAKHVRLHMELPEPHLLVLHIKDAGVGFDANAVRQAGVSVGMRSMHTRIARVDGILLVHSEPGQTVLSATLRLRSTVE